MIQWFSQESQHAFETFTGHKLKNPLVQRTVPVCSQDSRFTGSTPASPSRITGEKQQIQQTSSACTHTTSCLACA